MRRNMDGNGEQIRGNAARRSRADPSKLGHGHDFGPQAGGEMRRPSRAEEGLSQRNSDPLADQGPPNERESRGPETSHYLEDDTFTSGTVSYDGRGRRNRSTESATKPREHERDEFDDDLVR